MAANCTAPTPTAVEINAAGRELAEAHGCHPDGFWRETARAMLEAASEAQMAEFIVEIDRLVVHDHRYEGATQAFAVGHALGGTLDAELGQGRN
jgi:hypothetical protein